MYISANEVVKIIWNDEDEKLLQKCVEKNLIWEEIAQILHRSKYSVIGKARLMGLCKTRKNKKNNIHRAVNKFRRYRKKLKDSETIETCLSCTKTECDNCMCKFT